MEFIIEDKVKTINDDSETIRTLTRKESEAVDSRINEKMQQIAREFRDQQNKAIEASSKVFLT